MKGMAEKKKFPQPPDFLLGPFEALERFNSAVESFQNAIAIIDQNLSSIDKMTGQIDKRFSLPTPQAGVPVAKPKPHEHISFEGQSELDYCLECAVKHSQTAKVKMREALQRAEAGSPSDTGVLEKVRGVVEELVGMEDDTATVKNDKVSTLNSLSRSLRKYIYGAKAEVGGASLKDLREIKGLLNKLVGAVYTVRESEECIGCTVESVCGGNVECVRFVEERIRGVKDAEAIRKVLVVARDRYGRG